MQITLPISLLKRFVNRLEQDFQPLQPVGDGARCQVQTQQLPRGQQAFGRPKAEILVQDDLDPHRDAVSSFGDQLGIRPEITSRFARNLLSSPLLWSENQTEGRMNAYAPEIEWKMKKLFKKISKLGNI